MFRDGVGKMRFRFSLSGISRCVKILAIQLVARMRTKEEVEKIRNGKISENRVRTKTVPRGRRKSGGRAVKARRKTKRSKRMFRLPFD